MNLNINYDYSEDLFADNSSLLSIYDDVLCNHTIGDYTDVNNYDEDDDDLFSFDDASDGSVLYHADKYPHAEVVARQVLRTSTNDQTSSGRGSATTKLNPRRWETVKPVKKEPDFCKLVVLQENDMKFDDYSRDGLSLDHKSDILSVSEYPPPQNISVEWSGTTFGGLSSRMQMSQIFPTYKDILTSKYFLV